MANKPKTLADTNYLAPGTYKKQLAELITFQTFPTIVLRTLLAPLQRWKLINQTQYYYPLRPKKFKNIFDYFKRIPSEQGFKNFWRGNYIHCFMLFPQIFLQTIYYDNMAYFVNNSFQRTFLRQCCLPLTASFISLFFLHPLDTIRVRLTMNYDKQPQFWNISSTISEIKIRQKFSKLYRGYFLSAGIAYLQFNFYRGIYSMVEPLLKQQTHQAFNIYNTDFLSNLAVLAILHPLDTLRRIIQLNNQSKPVLFNNIRLFFTYNKNINNLSSFTTIKKLYNGMTISMVKNILNAPLYVGIIHLIKQKDQVKQ